MWLTILVEVVAFVAIPYFYHKAYQITGKSLLYGVCHGQTPLMGEILFAYRGLTAELSAKALMIQVLLIVAVGGLFLAELICYIMLYAHVYKGDESALKKGIAKKDSVEKRHKKNMMTFSGQALVSVFELMLIFVGVGMMSMGSMFGIDKTYAPIALIVISAGISVATFIASPELRRHFWKSV